VLKCACFNGGFPLVVCTLFCEFPFVCEVKEETYNLSNIALLENSLLHRGGMLQVLPFPSALVVFGKKIKYIVSKANTVAHETSG
jgi:hypothetical protein